MESYLIISFSWDLYIFAAAAMVAVPEWPSVIENESFHLICSTTLVAQLIQKWLEITRK